MGIRSGLAPLLCWAISNQLARLCGALCLCAHKVMRAIWEIKCWLLVATCNHHVAKVVLTARTTESDTRMA